MFSLKLDLKSVDGICYILLLNSLQHWCLLR